jgi:uroporphyrinogen decarboxylase
MSYDIDVRAFWQENERCMAPFTTDKPRMPLTFWLDDHFVLQEMALPSTVRYFTDLEYRLEINRACNERLEAALGKHFYPEKTIHRYKGDFEVAMGAGREITEGNTPWIVPIEVDGINDVKRWIDWASRMDVRKAAIPDDWYEEKARFEAASGAELHLAGFGNTGPATLACNILGTTNVCLFIMDAPEVMRSFFEVLCDRYIEYYELVSTENLGYVPREGFGINDDNCFLFSPRKYEALCAPFVRRLFSAFAPAPHHWRRQHSDSAMGHLMGILHDLGVNEVNLGPSIHPREIREAMPNAVIHGQMPPFTLRNGSAQEIIELVKRDIDCLGGDGGLVECPAGAVPIGTPLENIRTYMWAVQEYGRYE